MAFVWTHSPVTMAEPEHTNRSLLWGTYFTKMGNEGKCLACKKVLQCKGGNTVGLSRHLEAAHRKLFLEYQSAVAKRKTERTEKAKRGRNESGSSQPPQKKAKEDFFKMHVVEDHQVSERFHDALIEHIADCHASFGQFGTKSFQKVVSTLNKRVKVKHPTTLSRMVTAKAESVRKEVASILRAVKVDMVSLGFTTDLWTSRASDSFISLTLSFLDKDWAMHNWTPFVRLLLEKKNCLFAFKLDQLFGAFFNVIFQALPGEAPGLHNCSALGQNDRAAGTGLPVGADVRHQRQRKQHAEVYQGV